MSAPIIATKLYLPPLRPKVIQRPRLNDRLNEGLLASRKLTLISAPAGFGKTTLICEWITAGKRPAAWLSVDEADSDLRRFLVYFIAALQTINPSIGARVLGTLQSPQPPSTEAILSILIDDITTVLDQFVFVLDDYHTIDSKPIDTALTFLIEHLPPQMCLVIATRENPDLPLARLRARNQLTELRGADLQFTKLETSEFLNQVMDLNLSVNDITALETRTEGWIASLWLRFMQGQQTPPVSSNLHWQSLFCAGLSDGKSRKAVRKMVFFTQTSILSAVWTPLMLFFLPHWYWTKSSNISNMPTCSAPLITSARYRYHHLFTDLLRHRLQQITLSSVDGDRIAIPELHRRASRWYEVNDLYIEAFQHAAATGDVDHAVSLIEGKGIPLYHRGGSVPLLNWLGSLPKAELDKRPALWLTYARALTTSGQASGVEEKLQAAETALQGTELSPEHRDLIGSIASNRATMAYAKYEPDTVIAQARRALEYLSPNNLPTRMLTTFTLGVGYMQKGNRTAAIRLLWTQNLSAKNRAYFRYFHGHDGAWQYANYGK